MEQEQVEITVQDAIAFPSVEWFERLAQLMKFNRARNEHLGYIDCVAMFTVLDGGLRGRPWSAQVTFDEFEATEVREATTADLAHADFALDATMATWREMIAGPTPGSYRTRTRCARQCTW